MEQLDKVRPVWKTGGIYVTLTYHVRGVDDFRFVLGDPEYQKRGRESEKDFIDTSKGELHIGWETVPLKTARSRTQWRTNELCLLLLLI